MSGADKDTQDLYDLLAQIRDVLTERLPEVKAEPVPTADGAPEPLAEPQWPGAVVVDGAGRSWLREEVGHWRRGLANYPWGALNYDYGPLRLPTPEERTKWGMPQVLGEGEVAVKTLTPPGMAETWRSYADHADERGCIREVGEMLRRVADALGAGGQS